jgi:hypothetical protein
VRLARFVAGLDVDDAWTATDGAVLGVGLRFSAAQIDRKLVSLAAKRALDDGGG